MDSIIRSLTCQLNAKNSNEIHLLENPKKLPCCNRSVCQKCIIRALSIKTNANDFIFDCPFCQKTSRIKTNGDNLKLDTDEYIVNDLKRNLNDINQYLVEKLETSYRGIEDHLDLVEKKLEKKKSFIKNEIHLQVETLKMQLEQLENELCSRLDLSCHNVLLNMKKFEKSHRLDMEDMKLSIENIKTNTKSFMSASKSNVDPDFINVLQIQCVNKCQEHLDELSFLTKTMNDMAGELKFEPNIDSLELNVIGDLRQVQEINFMEQFKSIKSQSQISRIKSIPGSIQQMPISPRYLCIVDPYHLVFTDSQSKQLVQLTLQSGDYVRSINLGGQLKNPDGICMSNKGFIYVSDTELRLIFKVDTEFNVVKKFGKKDLKWPRGMAYDSEGSSNGSVMNPNRLYVCDYSNQRVAIYNEHEQLRDWLMVGEDKSRSVSSSRDESVHYGNKYHSHLANDSSMLSFDSINVSDENKFCPLNVCVSKTLVYVTDDWTGGNCIRVFDKQKNILLRNVGDLNAWNPLGLIVDDTGNLFTLARLYYETGSTHLVCFDKNGELLYKTNLNLNSEYMSDIVVDKWTDKTNHRLICTGDKKLHIFQF